MISTLARVAITRTNCFLLRASRICHEISYRKFSATLRKPDLISRATSCGCSIPSSCTAPSNDYLRLTQRRNKSKSSKGRKTTEIEEEEDDYDNASSNEVESDDQFMKAANLSLPSTRLDLVLKTAFNISRNKIENSFYQNRIYVNGNLASKKNHDVQAKDEIDIVRGKNEQNDRFIDVMRLEILSVQVPKGGTNILIKMHRFKQLTIENYTTNPWSGSSED